MQPNKLEPTTTTTDILFRDQADTAIIVGVALVALLVVVKMLVLVQSQMQHRELLETLRRGQGLVHASGLLEEHHAMSLKV